MNNKIQHAFQSVFLSGFLGIGILVGICSCDSGPVATHDDARVDPQPDAIIVSDNAIDVDAKALPQITFYSRGLPEDPWTPTQRSFWGDEVDVRFTGLPANDIVIVNATSGPYRSSASFRTTAQGTLNLATTAPLSGDYGGADADGLLWSMTTSGDPTALTAFEVTFNAQVQGTTVVSATLDRYWTPEGTQPKPVSAPGITDIVGVFVPAPGAGPHPALIAFGGSEGGIISGQLWAQYYAALGYSCLGLAYFAESTLPKTLTEIPLEYFEKAITWLQQQPQVDANHIGVMGGSRGGELALLLGATYPQIKAVVAIAPSGVVWPGSSNSLVDKAAWTLNGVDIPFIPSTNTQPVITKETDGRDLYTLAPLFISSIESATLQARQNATIAVEKTQGAVLMLAGDDDQLWSACKLAQIAVDRLNAKNHTQFYGDEYECYPNTGHRMPTPGIPTTGISKSYLQDAGVWLNLGGTPAGAAHAARDADRRIRRFLRTNLMAK